MKTPKQHRLTGNSLRHRTLSVLGSNQSFPGKELGDKPPAREKKPRSTLWLQGCTYLSLRFLDREIERERERDLEKERERDLDPDLEREERDPDLDLLVLDIFASTCQCT